MPLEFGPPTKPPKPATQKLEIGALALVVDAAGLLVVRRCRDEVLRTDLLVPRLTPPGARDRDGESQGAPPLTEGKLVKEDVAGTRHYYRLTGQVACPGRPDLPLEYEARFHLGPDPLLAVEYVRLRNPGGRVWLDHWEHGLALGDLQGWRLGAEEEVRPAPVCDLALESGAGTAVLAVLDGATWIELSSSDLSSGGPGALTLSGLAGGGDGMDRRDPDARGLSLHRLSLHGLAPPRAYSGALEIAGAGARLEPGAALSLSFALHLSGEAAGRGAPPCTTPLRRERPDEVLLLYGQSGNDDLARRLRDRIDYFAIATGPLTGLYHGGYDHLNGRCVETPANRAESGEYLLNEYYRSGDRGWLERALAFGRAHLDLLCMSGSGGAERGGVRRRGSTAAVCPERSCRTARLFLHLHSLTGDPAYMAAAQANGEYIVRCATKPPVAMVHACPQLAALWYHTGGGQYGAAAREIAARVAARQNADGSWHQWHGEDGAPGPWRGQMGGEYLDEAPVRPRVVAECVVSLLDMVQILASAEGVEAARRGLDWLVSVQRPEGAWGSPTATSRGQCGAGAFVAARAMLQGYRRFEDERYLEAGMKAFDWAVATWDRVGYLPAVVGPWPHERAEVSAALFDGLEAAALWRELGRVP